MRRRTGFAASIAALFLVLGTGTPSFAAAPVFVFNTLVGPFGCNSDAGHPAWDNSWVYVITGVGGSTGITPPASVLAIMSIPDSVQTATLAEVTGDGDLPTSNSAFYVLRRANTGIATGKAQALIDDAWNPATNNFLLQSMPCDQPVIIVNGLDLTAEPGATVDVSGSLRMPPRGDGLPDRQIDLSFRATGQTKAEPLGTTKTDEGGNYAFTVKAERSGIFEVSYPGSGTTRVPGELGWSQAISLTVVSTPPTTAGPPTEGPPTEGPPTGGPPPTEGPPTSTQSPPNGPALPPTPPVADGPLLSEGGTTLETGAQVVLSGTGFAPNSTVTIGIYSTPIVLATVKANGDGAIRVVITLPAGLTGDHILVAAGKTIGGLVRYLTLAVHIDESIGAAPPGDEETGGLPITGQPVFRIGVVGLLLIAGGSAIWWFGRRRETDPA